MNEKTSYAALARHVKAALLHLRQAEDLAELAGVDIHASEHDVSVAGLIRAAGGAVQDLDMWAIGNARAHGAAPAETYAHTENWCHAEGGSLPAGSWPSEPAPISAYLNQVDAQPEAAPDPARRTALRSELKLLQQAGQAWNETARACICPPGLCSRRDFRDHTGEYDPSGCMVCADLDPDKPCYAAVLRCPRVREGQR